MSIFSNSRKKEKYKKKNEKYVANLNKSLDILSKSASSQSITPSPKVANENKKKKIIYNDIKNKNTKISAFDEIELLEKKNSKKKSEVRKKKEERKTKNIQKKDTIAKKKKVSSKKSVKNNVITKFDISRKNNQEIEDFSIELDNILYDFDELNNQEKSKKLFVKLKNIIPHNIKNPFRREKKTNINLYDSKIKTVNSRQNESISDLFKQVQDIRYGKRKAEKFVKEKPYEYRSRTPDYYRKIRRKFYAAGAIMGSMFIITFFTSIHTNYIFATGEEEKKAIAEFEQNKNPLNTMNIISNNISDFEKKEIATEEISTEYETRYAENDQLPMGERVVVQTGSFGTIERTTIKTYESEKLIDEKIISENIKKSAVDEVIDVGKSQFLADVGAHIGDDLYTKEEILMHENASDESTTICSIYQYVPVRIVYLSDDAWCIVSVDNKEGYVRTSNLTSESQTPGIKEKVRVQRLMLSLNKDMSLNSPSGLTRDDFVKVLSGHNEDENHIFENNAKLFYDMENRYNINGVFLAAVGIHESNWGRSEISIRKKNLFGYGSYDESPFASSYTFDSYEYGIELVAKVLVKYYLNEEGTNIYDGETAVGTYYNGPTVDGVNIRYASDPEWSNKVFAIMKSLYENIRE